MNIQNERGIALVIALFVMVILMGFCSVFILRTIHESRLAKKELAMAQSFYIAEGGANAALEELDKLVNTYMTNTINATNPSTVINNTQTYITSHDGIGFLMATVLDSGTPLLTLVGADADYTIPASALGNGTYTCTIEISEKTDPVTVTPDSWDFPYNYRLLVQSSADNTDKRAVLNGDFTVRVQRDNFAKYALFTNNQTTPGGSNVWFTDKTNFAGPLHTNGRFNFALNPSGTFDGLIEQTASTARFYNNGFPVLLDADTNGTKDTPTFNAGFVRGADPITLSSATQQQDVVDQALGGTTVSTNGIYVPNSGGALTGGIYVKGDSTVTMAVNASDQAVYTIQQGGATKTITVDDVNNQTTVNDGSTSTVYNGQPTGLDHVGTVIYVDGQISGLQGTVQKNTELTVASANDVVIGDNIRYEDYTPGVGTPGQAGYVPPSAKDPVTGNDAKNLLGIVSWNGDVRIGTSAPDNVDIHGTVLAKNGIFQVDDYNNTGAGGRGTATLLGGVITDNYGAFGLFNGSTGTQISGYGRNFVYDGRMETGNAPPYFPSLNTFVAFTNDITDKMIWQEGES